MLFFIAESVLWSLISDRLLFQSLDNETTVFKQCHLSAVNFKNGLMSEYF